MQEIEKLMRANIPHGATIFLLTKVGSKAYGTDIEGSDDDYKGIYVQSNEDILTNKYVPHIQITPDFQVIEIRFFLELLLKSNPNILELLFVDREFIVTSSDEYEIIRKEREKFLTKALYGSFYGYAMTQIDKARSLTKKTNYKLTERKDILDFCFISEVPSLKRYPIKEWLAQEGLSQEVIGLVKVDGEKDTYKAYVDSIEVARLGDRFSDIKKEDTHGYRGIYSGENAQEVKVSQIPKWQIDNPVGVFYFNSDAYSTHCKEWKEYQKWLKNRNELRYATNQEHGQGFDSKNLSHSVRLITMAEEMAEGKSLIVNRKHQREELIGIRLGKVNLKSLYLQLEERTKGLREKFNNSNLPDKVDKELIHKLEKDIRYANNRETSWKDSNN